MSQCRIKHNRRCKRPNSCSTSFKLAMISLSNFFMLHPSNSLLLPPTPSIYPFTHTQFAPFLPIFIFSLLFFFILFTFYLLLFCPRLSLTCSFFHTSHLKLVPFLPILSLACSFFPKKRTTMHKKRSKLKPTPFISHQTIQWLCIQVCLLFSYSLVTFLPLCQNQKVIRPAEAYIWLFVAQSLLLTPPS